MPRAIQVSTRRATGVKKPQRKSPAKRASNATVTLGSSLSPSPRGVSRPSPIAPKLSRGGAEHDFEWILYRVQHDPLTTGATDSHHHKFTRVASGRMHGNVLPGTIARDIFTKHVFGELQGRAYDLRDIVAVLDVNAKTAVVFRGYKRLSAQGKYYTAVKTMVGPLSNVTPEKLQSMKWIRSHGNVLPASSSSSASSSTATATTSARPKKSTATRSIIGGGAASSRRSTAIRSATSRR